MPSSRAPPSLATVFGEKRPDLVPLFMNALPDPMIEAVDVSNAVLFLASPMASYVNGVVLPVDGGYLIT